MKMNRKLMTVIACLTLICVTMAGCFTANAVIAKAEQAPVAAPAADPSPAIYVAQKNADSVVGVISYLQQWNRSTGNVEETAYAQGSGVVIAEGGYILTNYHVVEKGEAFKVLMPNGDKVEAVMTGSDSSVDMAVIQVVDEEARKALVPVTVGTTDELTVGSTVIAIGNPGGEILANTVTQGIVSSLQRSSVYSNNTTRNIDYIQHDAAINNGNSGGALFNYKGELVGINTLKYGGNAYSGASYDGLGFAIPVETAYPVAQQLIEFGKVIRPQMGITVATYEGPDEPMTNFAPASVCVFGINEDGPAADAGMKQYDFIYSVNGTRVKTFRELTAIMDRCEAGDTVEVVVVRYNNVQPVTGNYSSNGSNGYGYYGFPFGGFPFGGYDNYGNYGGYGSGNGSTDGSTDGSDNGTETAPSTQVTDLSVGGGWEYVTLNVTLEMPEEN